MAVVGSADITTAAMLKTARARHGNCELALLCDLGAGDLTPPTHHRLEDTDDIREGLAEPLALDSARR
jgi:hypothetical protein